MKKLLLSIYLLLCIVDVYAQSNYYLFRTGTHTYADLANDTAIVPAKFGTGDMWAFELNGETFPLFGKNFVMDGVKTLVSFSNSGHMRVEDDTSLIILDGLFYFMDSIDGNSKLSYIVEGSGNDKILKVQWKNLKIQSGPVGNFVNFQVWLYKKTGIFEIRYGASSANNQTGYSSTTGPNVGLFYAKQDFSKMYEKIWITQSPASYVIDSAKNLVFNAMHGVPANGTVYRFIPKHIAVSVNEIAGDKAFTISPNPATTQVIVTAVKHGLYARIQVTDASGRVISQGNITTGKYVIDTRGIADGIYTISIRGRDIDAVEKIVVQH